MIQSTLGINALHFSTFHLDNAAFPHRCDIGSWEDENEDHIPYCLAYQPGYAGTLADDPEYIKAARAHWQFMRQLVRAVDLAQEIRNDSLAKITAGLNAATESLPAALAAGSNERGI